MADTKITAEVAVTLRGLAEAADSADPEGYAGYHTEDCTIMYQDMETVHGKEAVKEHMKFTIKNNNIRSSALESIDYVQQLSDNKVYCSASSKSVDSTGQTIKFRIIMLLRKEGDQWLIERKFVNLRELLPQVQAKAAIKAQMLIMYDAFSRKDVDGILKVYMDEATWIVHGEEDTIGKEAGRLLLLRWLPSFKTMELDEIFYFEMFGDVAYTNTYVNYIDENGKVYNRIRDNFLWKKVSGTWLVQRDSFNDVPVK